MAEPASPSSDRDCPGGSFSGPYCGIIVASIHPEVATLKIAFQIVGRGGIHHVMARRPDRRTLFHDDRDREDLVACLADAARDEGLAIFAWALMSNHFHLLVETAGADLDGRMRAIGDRFAGALSARRGGARVVVPSAWKSDLCRTGRHFVELVRYIHLNPLRAGVVRSIDALEDYPWTGHSALLATVPRSWQSVREVLERFGRTAGWARAAYRKFVCDGAGDACEPLARRRA